MFVNMRERHRKLEKDRETARKCLRERESTCAREEKSARACMRGVRARKGQRVKARDPVLEKERVREID